MDEWIVGGIDNIEVLLRTSCFFFYRETHGWEAPRGSFVGCPSLEQMYTKVSRTREKAVKEKIHIHTYTKKA